MHKVLRSEAETEAFAGDFVSGRNLFGFAVGFSGPLGAGKTTLIRYLVQALGCSAQVSSPSYVLCHEYPLEKEERIVEHWDLYRVGELPEELFEPPAKTTLRLIEWPERFSEVLRSLDEHLHLSYSNTPGSRVLRKAGG